MGGAAALETGVRLRLGGLDRRATALRGCFGQLLGWPPARRVVTVDYPEEDGLRADLGGGLYDGAPRELRVPLHFADAGGRPGEAQALLEGLAAGRPGLARLEAPGVGYEGWCAVLGVGGVARGARGAWGEVALAEAALPPWLAGPWAGRGGFGFWDFFRGGAFTMAPGAWLPPGGAARKRMALGRLPPGERAGYAGLEEVQVALPCEARAGAWGELLGAYGSMWRWLAGREAPADIQTPWARYEGARYVSQRVLLVAGGPPRVRFEVVLAARRAARL